MSGLNTFSIVNNGLTHINNKIIGSRTYDSSLIDVIGNPMVEEGIASNFSADNYFTHSGLTFNNSDSITISFKGIFALGEETQCPFELFGLSDMPLTLSFTNTEISLHRGLNSLFSITGINLEDESDISIFLNLKSTSYEFAMTYGGEVIQKSGTFSSAIPLSEFNGIGIGNSPLSKDKPWLGSINLNEFYINCNGSLLYAPSQGTSWHFSHLLIADENFELTDKTRPVANHIYECPITEISRSGNTVILTCKIDDEAHLIINKIGLYIKTPEDTLLFGIISNLNVGKEDNLPYELILAVDTSLRVVNAVGFPSEDSIVVADPEYPQYKDFVTIEQVNTYVLTNLERIIRMNAGAKGSYINTSIVNAQPGIGHNRPQVIYRVQKELEEMEDCYETLDTFIQLVKKFQRLEELEVNFNTFSVHGNLEVPTNGKVSKFSNSDYITRETYFNNTSNWSVESSFIAKKGTTGTIIALKDDTTLPALDLYMNNNKCYVQGRRLSSVLTYPLDLYYYRDNSRDTVSNGVNYYAWRKVAGTTYYNFHCVSGGEPLACAQSSVIPFPRSSNVVASIAGTLNYPIFTFTMRVKFSTFSNITLINTGGNTGFKLYVQDKKLRAELFDKETSTRIQGDLVTRFNLKENKYYKISLSYDGEKYSLYYKMEPSSEEEYAENETILLYSDQEICPYDPDFPLSISRDLRGEIDFSNVSLYTEGSPWTGAIPIDTIFTKAEYIQGQYTTYDNDFQVIYAAEGQEVTATPSSHNTPLFNIPLFNVNSENQYNVKIAYSENTETQKGTYTAVVKAEGFPSQEIEIETVNIEQNLSNRIGIPDFTYIGNTIDTSSPFSETINLLDFNITQGDNTWIFSENVILNDAELIQYYRLPYIHRNQYVIKDLCNSSKYIRFIDDRFQGNLDVIDFSYPEGLTLSMKVDLKDAEPKVILYKSDLSDNVYFSLTFINQTLEFSMMTMNGTATLSKELSIPEYDSYTKEPINITITVRPQFENYCYVRMYKNNEPITDEMYIQINNLADPAMFILSNYIKNMPTYIAGDEVKTVEAGKYVEDIVVLKGCISEEYLRYLNNLFDTNY